MRTRRVFGAALRKRMIAGACCAAACAASAWGDADVQSTEPASQPAASSQPTTSAAAVVATTEPTTGPASRPAATSQPTTMEAVGVATTEPASRPATGPATAPAKAAAPAASELARAVKARNFARQPKRVLEVAFPSTAPTTVPTTLPATMAATKLDDSVAARAERLERDVLLGRWEAVAAFLAPLKPEEADPIYQDILNGLAGSGSRQPTTPEEAERLQIQQMRMQQSGQSPPPAAETLVLPEDVLALADAYPYEPTAAHTAALGKLFGAALNRSEAKATTYGAIERGLKHYGGSDPTDRRRAVELLTAAGLESDALKFLAPLPADSTDYKQLEARVKALIAEGNLAAQRGNKTDDAEIADLKRIYEMYGYSASQVPTPAPAVKGFLPQHAEAMALIGRMLQLPSIEPAQRAAAIDLAMGLMDKVEPALGDEFLKRLVADRPANAGALLTSVGAAVAGKLSTPDVSVRAAGLKMQQRVVQLVLERSEFARPEMRAGFDALAMNWLAEVKANESQPSTKERARSGGRRTVTLPNGEMASVNFGQSRNGSPTLAEDALLATGPQQGDGRWMAACDASLRGAIVRSVASLTIRDERPVPALEWIEMLAKQEPSTATDYAGSLLRAWARSINPNPSAEELEQQRQAQQRGYSSGKSPETSIALTRVRQSRNLTELATLLGRMRALPGGPPDVAAIADAFVRSHSEAEVFRPESIEAVFGPVGQMDQDALGEILATMRRRLAQQWRTPQAQQQAGTKRDDKAIAAEVERGYYLILTAVAASHAGKGVTWRTEMTAASALFDLNEFKYGRGLPLAEYTQRRDEAFARFKVATDAYRAVVADGTLSQANETVDPYMNWFLAAQGASDLAQLTRQQAPQTSQIRQVKDALAALPADAARRHLALFATTLSGQAKTISPELKYRYFRAGIDVVGDHPNAQAARDLVRYYDELLEEVQFVARLDAPSTAIGTKPFGLHLGVRHTEPMGRESGGFGRYLTQPNAQQAYYAQQQSTVKNDRDRVERNIRESLSDAFEIVSITWHSADVTPRGDTEGKPGWRYTPLAFVLLKVKDASADRVPPVRMDLDFRDGSGRVVLPIETSVVAVDAKSSPSASASGLSDVTLAETIDESEAANGQLTLDVRASGNGLLPELGELVDVSKLAPWTIEKTGDGTLTVAGLDATGEIVRPQTTRSWVLTLKMPREAKPAAPTSFNFPTLLDGIEAAKDGVKYQRYEGTDLVSTPATIELKPIAGGRRGVSAWLVLAAAFVLAIVAASYAWMRRRRKGAAPARSASPPPAELTPFSLIAWLRRLESQRTFRGEPQTLRDEIRRLEARYFGREVPEAGDEDLVAIARRWASA